MNRLVVSVVQWWPQKFGQYSAKLAEIESDLRVARQCAWHGNLKLFPRQMQVSLHNDFITFTDYDIGIRNYLRNYIR